MSSHPHLSLGLPPWAVRALVGATIAATVVRLFLLGDDCLVVDEAATWIVVTSTGHRFWRLAFIEEGNMGAFYLLLHGVVGAFGDSEAVLRSVSAVCGALAIPLFYLLARRLVAPAVALVATAILAAHTGVLWFCREARSYPMLMLFGILSTYAVVRAVERPERLRFWALYVASSAVALAAHVLAPLFLVAHCLALGREDWRRVGLKRAAAVVLSISLLTLPLIAFVFFGRPHDTVIEPAKKSLDELLLLVMFIGCGLPLFLSGFNPLLAVAGVMGATRAARGVRGGDFRSRLRSLLFWIPMAGLLALYVLRTVGHFSYVAVVMPGLSLWMAEVLTPDPALPEKKRRRRGALLFASLAISLIFTFFYSLAQTNARPDWRRATEYILAHAEPTDALLFYDGAGRDLFHYYARQAPSRARHPTLPPIIFPPPDLLASGPWSPRAKDFADEVARYPRVWVVLFQRELSELDPGVLRACKVVEQHRMPGNDPFSKPGTPPDDSKSTPGSDFSVARCDRSAPEGQ